MNYENYDVEYSTENSTYAEMDMPEAPENWELNDFDDLVDDGGLNDLY